MIARFWNAGQSCLAAKRLYVFDEIYDDFVAALTGELERYECGEGWTRPEKPKLRMGPVHTQRGRDELADQLEDAVSRGATVLHGGGPPSDRDKGFYFEPTLVENAPARLAPRDGGGLRPDPADLPRRTTSTRRSGSRTTLATGSGRPSGPTMRATSTGRRRRSRRE